MLNDAIAMQGTICETHESTKDSTKFKCSIPQTVTKALHSS